MARSVWKGPFVDMTLVKKAEKTGSKKSGGKSYKSNIKFGKNSCKFNFLKGKAGISSHHYSYPEGQKIDFNESVIEELKKNNIKCCPTAIDGLNDLKVGSMFELKRVMVN